MLLHRITTVLLTTTLWACGGGGTGKADVDASVCFSPADCLDELAVCNPNTMQCDTALPCDPEGDISSQCGPEAFCATGVCRPATTGTPCENDGQCAGQASCQEAELCGCEQFDVEPELKRARVLLVLDYSGSMGVQGISDQAAAVNDLLASQGAEKDFGLLMYPGPNESGCGVEPPQVLPGPNTTQAIQTAMNGIGAHGSTPMLPAFEVIKTTDPLRISEAGPKLVIVGTDGSPNCGSNQDIINIATQMQVDGVLTFGIVIDNGNTNFMDQLAAAGGTGSAFRTSNPQQLSMAMGQIASSVFSCLFELPAPPEAGVDLVVSIDGVVIPPAVGANPIQGWRLVQGNIVELYGNDCDNLQSGNVKFSSIVAGCPKDPG